MAGITHAGFLKKEGGIHKNWKQRYFQLKDGILTYWANDTKKRSLGELSIVKVFKIEDWQNPKRANCIRLHTKDRIWKFAAESQKEKDEWIHVFNTVKYGQKDPENKDDKTTDSQKTSEENPDNGDKADKPLRNKKEEAPHETNKVTKHSKVTPDQTVKEEVQLKKSKHRKSRSKGEKQIKQERKDEVLEELKKSQVESEDSKREVQRKHRHSSQPKEESHSKPEATSVEINNQTEGDNIWKRSDPNPKDSTTLVPVKETPKKISLAHSRSTLSSSSDTDSLEDELVPPLTEAIKESIKESRTANPLKENRVEDLNNEKPKEKEKELEHKNTETIQQNPDQATGKNNQLEKGLDSKISEPPHEATEPNTKDSKVTPEQDNKDNNKLKTVNSVDKEATELKIPTKPTNEIPALETNPTNVEPVRKSKTKKKKEAKKKAPKSKWKAGVKKSKLPNINDKEDYKLKETEETDLTIRVVEAKKLKAADLNGKSDPYVKIIKLDQHKKKEQFQTQTKFKDLNPVWNETFKFKVHLSDVFKITVWDYDKVGKDDKIGNATILVKSLKCNSQANDMWIDLEGVKTGRLHLELTLWKPAKEEAERKTTGISRATSNKEPTLRKRRKKASESGPKKRKPINHSEIILAHFGQPIGILIVTAFVSSLVLNNGYYLGHLIFAVLLSLFNIASKSFLVSICPLISNTIINKVVPKPSKDIKFVVQFGVPLVLLCLVNIVSLLIFSALTNYFSISSVIGLLLHAMLVTFVVSYTGPTVPFPKPFL